MSGIEDVREMKTKTRGPRQITARSRPGTAASAPRPRLTTVNGPGPSSNHHPLPPGYDSIRTPRGLLRKPRNAVGIPPA